MCCLLWFTVIYDDPMRHPCISVREKDHIVSSLAQQVQYPPLPRATQSLQGSTGLPEGAPLACSNTHTDQLFPFSPLPVDGQSP